MGISIKKEMDKAGRTSCFGFENLESEASFRRAEKLMRARALRKAYEVCQDTRQLLRSYTIAAKLRKIAVSVCSAASAPLLLSHTFGNFSLFLLSFLSTSIPEEQDPASLLLTHTGRQGFCFSVTCAGTESILQ